MNVEIGDRVRFAPNPRYPDRIVEAEVIRRRIDPRCGPPGRTRNSKSPGWLDTRDDAGIERSVRPSRTSPAGGAG